MATEQTAQDCVRTLFRMLNGGDRKEIEAEIVEAIKGEHRTLQQAFFRSVVLTSISVFAENFRHGNHDLRNMESCKLADELHEIAKDRHLPFI